jgi:enoyl-CoA hydratase/carnithine racemase
MTKVVVSKEEAVLVLRLEGQDGLPRLARRVLAEIGREVERIEAAKDLHGCVITGSDTAFAVGADIEELANLSAIEAYEFSRQGQEVLRAIENSPKPVAAAIHGFCLGGGLDLALACHVRLASSNAVFAHPAGALGIHTGWGGTQRLARLMGRARAEEMLILGRKITATEALPCGLISEVVDSVELLPTAFAMLRRIEGRRGRRHP